jgi:hypothetical protein
VSRPEGCKCDFRTFMVGDGCEACNPKKALEYAKQTIDDLRAELAEAVEREREACAKVCEALPAFGPDDEIAEWYSFALLACAAAIRARSALQSPRT